MVKQFSAQDTANIEAAAQILAKDVRPAGVAAGVFLRRDSGRSDDTQKHEERIKRCFHAGFPHPPRRTHGGTKKGGITASTIRGNFVHLHHASSHQQRAARSS